MRADDINSRIGNMICPPKKKKRINWKKELKKERGRVIDEAINKLKREIRGKPESWHRGYYSAITQLEIMKDES